MKPLILMIMLGVMFFMPNKNIVKIDNIQDCFNKPVSIDVIYEGNKFCFQHNSDEYNQILNEFKYLIDVSHQVPAMGVSIDELTRQEKNQGVWIEFCFDKTLKNNDMPFDAILIKIEPESYGLNLIRKYQNKYDGRCFYLNLNKNSSNFYDYLNNLLV